MENSSTNKFKHAIFQGFSNNADGWIPPPKGYVCVCVNASIHQQGDAICEGVFQNEQEDWILGFRRELGRAIISVAELLAIRIGLEICHQQKFQKIKLFSDSLEAINMLSGDYHSDSSFNEVTAIHDLIYSNWDFVIKQTSRENLNCANYLAKTAYTVGANTILLWNRPLGCLDILLLDKRNA
ncbi:uncharacterized protein LOC129289853 [Prosopis cineraria]|uniref:uncharacterized protein LOC129289853 n=1 Tax=Prosopis cineraria TaxID=364024 RepID=UPI0024104123|nr:uncharacterized protein LOC129289853 [Prosopis cineraria]